MLQVFPNFNVIFLFSTFKKSKGRTLVEWDKLSILLYKLIENFGLIFFVLLQYPEMLIFIISNLVCQCIIWKKPDVKWFYISAI